MKQLLKANHKGGIMKQIVAMMIAGVMLTGCYATTGTVSKQDVSTGIGCVAGGVVGSKVGSGSGKPRQLFLEHLLDVKQVLRLAKT